MGGEDAESEKGTEAESEAEYLEVSDILPIPVRTSVGETVRITPQTHLTYAATWLSLSAIFMVLIRKL